MPHRRSKFDASQMIKLGAISADSWIDPADRRSIAKTNALSVHEVRQTARSAELPDRFQGASRRARWHEHEQISRAKFVKHKSEQPRYHHRSVLSIAYVTLQLLVSFGTSVSGSYLVHTRSFASLLLCTSWAWAILWYCNFFLCTPRAPRRAASIVCCAAPCSSGPPYAAAKPRSMDRA